MHLAETLGGDSAGNMNGNASVGACPRGRPLIMIAEMFGPKPASRTMDVIHNLIACYVTRWVPYRRISGVIKKSHSVGKGKYFRQQEKSRIHFNTHQWKQLKTNHNKLLYTL
jgi:hypothetical protein